MRVVATEYVTLDMTCDEPGVWSGPFFGEEAATFKFEELQAADALLLGRRTYEGFAANWPKFTDEVGFADKMNTMPKYVASTTLKDPEWTGAEVIEGDLLEAVRGLKERPGNDLLLSGSATVFNTLAQANLIDVYRLMVHPIVMGHGTPLF